MAQNRIDSLFELAGGDQDNGPGGSSEIAPGRFLFQDKSGSYVVRDTNGREVARGADQASVMSAGKRSSANISPMAPAPQASGPVSLFAEQAGPRVDSPSSPLGQDLRPVQPEQQPDAPYADPAQAVQSAGGQAAAAAPQTSTQTTGNAPGQPAPQRDGPRVTRDWSSPGATEAFTQEDFYPNPVDPGQITYTTGVEAYAHPGRMPMQAISKAASLLNNRQAELDKEREAFATELSKTFKTADPYQQNFNRIVKQQHNDFIQSIADAYDGGNTRKAWKRVMSSPQLRAQWRQQNAELEGLAQRGQYVFKKAEEYLANAASLKSGSTPELRALARDVMYGLGGYGTNDGTGGDFRKLIDKVNQFENLLGRDEYFRTVVAPSVEKFAASIPEKLKFDRNGSMWIMSEETKKSWDTQIDAIAREMTAMYGYGSYEENKAYLEKMLPHSIDRNTTVKDTYRGDSGGSGYTPITEMASAGVMNQNNFPDVFRGTVLEEFMKNFGDPNKQDRNALYVTPKYKSGDSMKTYSTIQVNDKSGGPETVGSPNFVYDAVANRWVIVGQVMTDAAKDEIRKIETEKAGDEDTKSSEIQKITSRASSWKTVAQWPASNNQSAVERMLKMRTVDDWVAASVNKSGGTNYTGEDIKRMLRDPQQREVIMRQLNPALYEEQQQLGPVAPQPTTALPQSAPSAGRMSAQAPETPVTRPAPQSSATASATSGPINYFKNSEVRKFTDPRTGKPMWAVAEKGGMMMPITVYFGSEDEAKRTLDEFREGKVLPDLVAKTKKAQDALKSLSGGSVPQPAAPAAGVVNWSDM